MSLFGKLLAIFNIFAVLGALALLIMSYAKRHTWEYAVYRQQLMINGLPLDETETDGQGRPLMDRVGEQTKKELFAGNAPVATQTAEVQRIKDQLNGKIQSAGDKKKQIYLLARVLTPLSLTAEQRADRIAYQTYLRDDESFKRLSDLFARADAAAKNPAPKDRKASTYEEGFHEFLALQYVDPPGPLAEAFLAVKKADAAADVAKALDQSLDAQLTQLQGQFEQAFKDALERRPPSEGVKADAPSQQKRAIANLLFNLVDVLPDEQPGGAAPKGNLWEDPGYKRFLFVVGVRAAEQAVNDQARLLDDITAEVAINRGRERSLFALEHDKVVAMIRDKAGQVEVHRLTKERKEQEVKDHEEDLKKRRLDVKFYQDQLDTARKETIAHLKDVRAMSDALFAERVKLRNATTTNQELEKQIRVLEEGR
jgi:hypothetical protein